MQENNNSEFQIPIGQHSPERVIEPISSEIKAAYESQSNISSYNQFFQNAIQLAEYKEVLHPNSEKVLRITELIIKNRDLFIDISNNNSKMSKKFGKSVFIEKLFKSAIPMLREKPLTLKDLKNRESAIGGTIFGDNLGQRLEFFCDGFNGNNIASWFFHIEDNNNNTSTIHYEVYPDRITKSTFAEGNAWHPLQGKELKDFLDATEIYQERVLTEIYHQDIPTNQKEVEIDAQKDLEAEDTIEVINKLLENNYQYSGKKVA